jgi:hypothetical protein
MSELRLASCHNQAAIPLTRECTDGTLVSFMSNDGEIRFWLLRAVVESEL